MDQQAGEALQDEEPEALGRKFEAHLSDRGVLADRLGAVDRPSGVA